MQIDGKTIVIGALAVVLLFLLFNSGAGSSTGAATGYQAVSNVPQMVGGC